MPRFTEAELADPVFYRDHTRCCPGCGAHWRDDPIGSGRTMTHTEDCEFLKQSDARDRRLRSLRGGSR